MPKTMTKTKVSTRTKVLTGVAVGLLAAGILAYGLGYLGSRPKGTLPGIRQLVTGKDYAFATRSPLRELTIRHLPLEFTDTPSYIRNKAYLPDMKKNPGGDRMTLYAFRASHPQSYPLNEAPAVKQFALDLTMPKNAFIGQFEMKSSLSEIPPYTVQAFRKSNPYAVKFPDVSEDSLLFIQPTENNETYRVVFTFHDDFSLPQPEEYIWITAHVLLKDPSGNETLTAQMTVKPSSDAISGSLINNRRTTSYAASPSVFHLLRLTPASDPYPAKTEGPFLYKSQTYLYEGDFIYTDKSASGHNDAVGSEGGTDDWFLPRLDRGSAFGPEVFTYNLKTKI